jgi:hypothetical protein
MCVQLYVVRFLFLDAFDSSDPVTDTVRCELQDGRALLPGSLDRRQPYASRSHYHWPVAGKPNASAWRVWRDALLHCLLPVQTHSLVLCQPLGPWMGIPAAWNWFYSPPLRCLYSREPVVGFRVYRSSSSRRSIRSNWFLPTPEFVPNLPSSALPTSVVTRNTSVQHTGVSSLKLKPPTPSGQSSAFTIIEQPSSLSRLLDGIREGSAIAVTDGSYKHSLGTAGFIILPAPNSTDSCSLTAVNMTPGRPQDVDSYRAELAGIFGTIQLINHVCTSMGIQNGHITLGCDCLSALQQIQSCLPAPPNRAHFDLVLSIQSLISSSPITWSFHHIRGHQDAHTAYAALDRWAQLNVDMDNLAKTYWSILDRSRPSPTSLQPLPGHWSIWFNDQRLPSWTLREAQYLYHRPLVKTYWNRRLGMDTSISSHDWEAAALALRRMPIHHRLWVPKWMCATLPFGRNLARWGFPEQLLCPRCGSEELELAHVLSCPHIDAAALLANRMASLAGFLDTSLTEPDLKQGLVTLVEAAINVTPWNPPTSTSALVRDTFAAQAALGPRHVILGFLSPLWSSTQQAYYDSLGRTNTGTRWASRVIRMIWQIAWDMWMHRRRVKDTEDDCSLSTQHAILDDAIREAFTSYAQLPTPDPSLHRWFARSPQALRLESLDWKHRWLEMVTTALPTRNR